MIREKSWQSQLFDIINICFLALLSLLMLYPLWYILIVSFSDHAAISLGSVKLLPVGFDMTAYRITFLNPDIWRAYFNSILYAVTGCALVLFLNSLTAFPLSCKEVYGRNVITIFFVITMFFSGGLIPTYLLILKLEMINTIWAIIVPGSVGVWTVIIFRTNFGLVPRSLIESAYIDGAKAWTIYLRIMLPLSKPIFATLGLFSIVAIWNDFFTPLIYLSSRSKEPLSIYLRSLIVIPTFESGHMASSLSDFALEEGSENMPGLLEGIKMAAIIVSTAPILIVYPFIQKYFVKGVLVGSIKG